MTSRQRIKSIFSLNEPDRTGFWLGNPHPDTRPLLVEAFGQDDIEGVRRLLNDDIRWIRPGAYNHPEGKSMWDTHHSRADGLASGGVFSNCEDVRQVEAFDWPDPQYLDFTDTLEQLRNAGDVYRLSGFWCNYFHVAANFMGMQNYFMKMFTAPDVVHAITRHVVDFFLEGNRRFYEQAGDLMDAFFIGNDFGTQIDLLVGPKQFHEFIFPYMKELTDQAHDFGYQVVVHCCGSIYKIIPDMIDIGVNGLHPLQAKAANMDAETLSREFGGKIGFMGGIDTQDLLVNGSPQDVKQDVRRVKGLLGPHLVVSPSHEALLPNVPMENVRAMAEAAVEE